LLFEVTSGGLPTTARRHGQIAGTAAMSRDDRISAPVSRVAANGMSQRTRWHEPPEGGLAGLGGSSDDKRSDAAPQSEPVRSPQTTMSRCGMFRPSDVSIEANQVSRSPDCQSCLPLAPSQPPSDCRDQDQVLSCAMAMFRRFYCVRSMKRNDHAVRPSALHVDLFLFSLLPRHRHS
jgi:hypothetical protein